MPLDAPHSAGSVIATLHYLIRGDAKPEFYIGGPPPGADVWSGIDDPHAVLIEDGRGREAEFTLDRNGFTLLKASTAVADFYSEEEVRGRYYPEVERLLQDSIGASRVFIFDHTVRNAAAETPDRRTPVFRVHNDHTVNSAPRRVRDHLGSDADELLRHRFGIVNVWRPIRPVVQSPLALCDAQSFTPDDLIPTDLVYPHLRGETSSVSYQPRHRWVYFSQMQPHETILIRVHDSADDGRARLSFHSAFEDPRVPPDAPARESIEVRALVFFPPED